VCSSDLAPVAATLAAAAPAICAPAIAAPAAAYSPYYSKVPLEAVANSARCLPKGWIAPNGADVTDAFIRYAAPLIGDGWPDVEIEGGLQRFARLEIQFIPQRCPPYTPCSMRPSRLPSAPEA
jgi:hypothetical protein